MSTQVGRATTADVPELARLFDAYRIFYERAPDLTAAEAFVRRQIEEDVTKFFIARDYDNGAAIGFVHLLPSVSTLAMQPIWYLEDLFVAPAARRRGVGEALMLQAERFARETGAERLTLSTAFDNKTAQSLYRRLGYERDEHFWYFHRLLR